MIASMGINSREDVAAQASVLDVQVLWGPGDVLRIAAVWPCHHPYTLD